MSARSALPARGAHRSWTRILRKAGVGHRGMHHLRQTFVTALAERGIPERAAQHLAGHADSRMTKEIYTHVTGSMLDHAAQVIDQAVTDVAQTNGSKSGSSVSSDAPEEAT
jgi:integrase